MQRLHEGVAEVEQETPFLIRELGHGDAGGFAGALQAQLPLVLTLVEIACREERQDIPEWPIGIAVEGLDLIEGRTEVRIGTKVSGDLLGLRFIYADLAGS